MVNNDPKPQDEIFDHAERSPEQDYYSIFTNRDGTKVYYRHDMNFFYRMIGTYGAAQGRWSYTNHQADLTY